MVDAVVSAMAESCDQHTITGDDRLHDDCSILPAIAALDLTAVNAYLCSESYALTPWKQADILVLEQIYRRFLHLLVTQKGVTLTPSRCIDEYWHAHILHTKRYVEDCQAIAGRYLHHHPDNPLSPDQETLSQGFDRTCQLYQQIFHEPLQVFVEDKPTAHSQQ